MSRHTGFASLPLHGGKAPAWLFGRMVRLSREIVIYLASEYGAHDVLRRLSDPFWFQAFGCVLGFDWHSSGVTTTVCGAVKEGIKDIDADLGFFAAGGKGNVSRKTPRSNRRVLRPHRTRCLAARLREQDGCEGRQRRRSGRLSALSPRFLFHERRRLVRRSAGNERRDAERRAATTGYPSVSTASSTSRTKPCAAIARVDTLNLVAHENEPRAARVCRDRAAASGHDAARPRENARTVCSRLDDAAAARAACRSSTSRARISKKFC